MAEGPSPKEAELLQRLQEVRWRKAAVDVALAKKEQSTPEEKLSVDEPQSRNISSEALPPHRQKYEEWKVEKGERLAVLIRERDELFERRARFYAGTDQVNAGQDILSQEEIDTIAQRAEHKIPTLQQEVQNLKKSEEAYRMWIRVNYSRHSCEGWQLRDYDTVKDIVTNDLLPRVLERCFDEQDRLRQRRRQHAKGVCQLRRIETVERHARAMDAEVSSLIRAVLKLKAKEVSSEVLSIASWIRQTSRTVCVVASHQSDVLEKETLADMWRSVLRRRAENERRHLSIHNQQLSVLGGDGSVRVGDEPTPICWNNVPSFQSFPSNTDVGRVAAEDEEFEQCEIAYWKLFKPQVWLSLHEKQESTTSAMNRTWDTAAIAFKDGSIGVWDLCTHHLAVTLTSNSGGNRSSPVISLAWSHDVRQLACIRRDGSFSVWAMEASPQLGPAASSQGNLSRGSRASVSRASKRSVPNLTASHDTPAGACHEGAPITATLQFHHHEEYMLYCLRSEELPGHSKPRRLVWPSRAAMRSTQDTFVFGMSCGSIIQLVVEPGTGRLRKRSIYQSGRRPLILLDVVKDQPIMISMDDEGTICQWAPSGSCLTIHGWYTPLSKHRLDMRETHLVHVEQHDKVLFSDRKRSGRFSQRISSERLKAEDTIARLQLPSQPWYKSADRSAATSIVNPSDTTPNTRTTFYSITRSLKDGKLLQLEEHIYEPQQGQVMPMLCAAIDPSRHVMLVALLGKGSPPRGAHITLLQVCLSDLSVVMPIITVPLNAKQHEVVQADNKISMALSDQLLCPGSRYCVLAIAGRIQVLSLATGQTVASAAGGEAGSELCSACQLSLAQSRVPAQPTALHLFHQRSHLGLLLVDKLTASVLELVANTSADDRRSFRAAFTNHTYHGSQPNIQRQHPAPHCLLFSAGDNPCSVSAVTEYIQDVVDVLLRAAMQQSDGISTLREQSDGISTLREPSESLH